QRSRWSLMPDGTWQQVSESVAPIGRQAEAPKDPELAAIDSLIERREFSAASKRSVRWLEQNPNSELRDRALLLTALALNGRGNGIKAFYYCDELMDLHPDSLLFVDAMQLQFDIADAYLRGRKDRFLMLPILNQKESALDMLIRIQQRAPASPIAERSLLRTATYYWDDGQFDLAADAYGFYSQRFARSPYAPDAKLREGLSNLAQFVGPLYDPRPVINGRAQLSEMIVEHPDLAKENDLQGKLVWADRQLARKLYLEADFYRRTHKPESAKHLCKRLIELYPNLPEAEDATKLLARLEGN
ncbi:MAG TPA: outer membrane protein assembly factor BamD, partial [Tepidisphaeraceae bacterium]|nr:outer membrane protein assembly factor BamD [Tepidisphaeraceae bacterium]